MKINRKRSPLNTTNIGLSLIVVLLVIMVLVSGWNIQRLVRNEDSVVHGQEVITSLLEVLGAVTDAETAERGYLITHDADYLESYRSAIERVRRTLERLAGLIVDEPDQRTRMADLNQRVDARISELRQAIAADNSGGFDAAKQAVSTNQGRRLMIEMQQPGGRNATERTRIAPRAGGRIGQ